MVDKGAEYSFYDYDDFCQGHFHFESYLLELGHNSWEENWEGGCPPRVQLILRPSKCQLHSLATVEKPWSHP